MRFNESKVPFPRTVAVAWSAVNTQANGHHALVESIHGLAVQCCNKLMRFSTQGSADADLLTVGCFVSLTQLKMVRFLVSLIGGA
jgi:hypothetical protein